MRNVWGDDPEIPESWKSPDHMMAASCETCEHAEAIADDKHRKLMRCNLMQQGMENIVAVGQIACQHYVFGQMTKGIEV